MVVRTIIRLQTHGDEIYDELPNGKRRYFKDLMSHKDDIENDLPSLKDFNETYSILQSWMKNQLPSRSEVLEIYGKIKVNAHVLSDTCPFELGINIQCCQIQTSYCPIWESYRVGNTDFKQNQKGDFLQVQDYFLEFLPLIIHVLQMLFTYLTERISLFEQLMTKLNSLTMFDCLITEISDMPQRFDAKVYYLAITFYANVPTVWMKRKTK